MIYVSGFSLVISPYELLQTLETFHASLDRSLGQLIAYSSSFGGPK